MLPNSKDFIKKGGKIITKEGRLGQNPQKKKKIESKKQITKAPQKQTMEICSQIIHIYPKRDRRTTQKESLSTH